MYIKTCDGKLINSKYLAYLYNDNVYVSDEEAAEIEQEFVRVLLAKMIDGASFAIGYFYDCPELSREEGLITTFWEEDINKHGTNTIYTTYGLTYDKLIEKVIDRSYFE